MSRLDRDTEDNLRNAFSVEMSTESKDAHLAAISSELNNAGAVVAGASTPWWRLRAASLAAALVVVVPVGTAIASEGAGPGDFLYPVKLFVEPIRSVVDSDVVARHRVDELVHIIDTPGETRNLADAITDARDATSDLPDDHQLRVYVDELTVETTDGPHLRDTVGSGTDHPAETDRTTDTGKDSPPETTTTTEAPARGGDVVHETTTTVTSTTHAPTTDTRATDTTSTSTTTPTRRDG